MGGFIFGIVIGFLGGAVFGSKKSVAIKKIITTMKNQIKKLKKKKKGKGKKG